MKRTVLTSLCAALLLTGTGARAAINEGLHPLITNIQDRSCQSLDGNWRAMVDQYENGYYNYRMKPMEIGSTFFADRRFYQDRTKLIEYDFDAAPTLHVPGDWNTQMEKLYYYEGTIWYRQLFAASPKPGKRYFIHFGAANYEAIAALNGKMLGKHTGGFTAFNFEVTDKLVSGENSLVVKVDNKRDVDGIPTANCDWWNYGGLTRSVNLVEMPQTFIRDYCVQLGKDGKSIEGWAQLDGPEAAGEVTLEIPELGLKTSAAADSKGLASFSVTLTKKQKLVRWSPSDPKLYDVKISSALDSVSDRIGFRTIETRGTKILLNGEEIFCKGVCIHDERPDADAGRAYSEDHARTTLGWAKEMGCNFVRLAHYPHNENMVRVAEEMGIMVWSEIPAYWTISWTNPETYENAENQLTEMITRDRNRANIIIWSVANETPLSDERLDFLGRLIDRTRELDPTRLVSAAMEKSVLPDGTMTVQDPLMEKTDLISFNQYAGWYGERSDFSENTRWTFPVEKPVLISEWGGAALYGNHGKVDERFSEEYMVDLYEETIKMYSHIPELAGTTPWILKDFRSPRRALYGIQDDYNRKGLISERGEKKQAFFVMQRWYGSF